MSDPQDDSSPTSKNLLHRLVARTCVDRGELSARSQNLWQKPAIISVCCESALCELHAQGLFASAIMVSVSVAGVAAFTIKFPVEPVTRFA